MRIVRFNCHAIREVSNNQNSSIGVAVNPTLAMINHSCDSNYGRVWKLDEDLVVAYATRPIKVIQLYYQITKYASTIVNDWPLVQVRKVARSS